MSDELLLYYKSGAIVAVPVERVLDIAPRGKITQRWLNTSVAQYGKGNFIGRIILRRRNRKNAPAR